MSDSTTSAPSDSRLRVIHGVDFSGADAGGEAGIRIASRPCVAESVVDRIERLDRTGLKRRILASLDDGHDHLWLIDAPFGLPLPTLEACGIPDDWSKTVEWMAGFRTPRDWRRGVRGVTRKEPRRLADRAAATPLASMNLRIFKQTWTAMVELLRPLADAGEEVARAHHARERARSARCASTRRSARPAAPQPRACSGAATARTPTA